MATDLLDLADVLRGTPPEDFAYLAALDHASPFALFIGHITAQEAIRRWTSAAGGRTDELAADSLTHGHAVFDRHDELCTEEPDPQGFLDCDCPFQLRRLGEQWFVELTTESRTSVPITRVACHPADRSLCHAD